MDKSLNENSFIHIRFKIKFNQFKIQRLQQVFVRLRHPEYKYATHYIPAKYNEQKTEYTAFVDLGDPDHIQPKNAEYTLEVLVGDEILAAPKTWDVTTLQVAFIQDTRGAPKTDAFYDTKEMIEFDIPPRRPPSPPQVIIFAFVGAIILAVLLFVYNINANVGVNLSQIPSSFVGVICTLSFIGTLGWLFVLLVLFWVKLNLLQMLPLLVVSSKISQHLIFSLRILHRRKRRAGHGSQGASGDPGSREETPVKPIL